MVRALNPWPGAFSNFRFKNLDLRIKLLKVSNEILKINKYNPGEFFIHENDLAVQCGQDALVVEKIQPEGKKPMTGKEFIQGYKNVIASKSEKQS